MVPGLHGVSSERRVESSTIFALNRQVVTSIYGVLEGLACLYYVDDDIPSYIGTLMSETKTETVTFRSRRCSARMTFAEIAEEEAKPVGELLRELIRERVKRQRRLAFEAEARRQSLECAAAARDPNSRRGAGNAGA